MPSKEEHVVKAESNARFASSLVLDDPARIDWALIATFYRDANLRKIYTEYPDLKYYSYNARYEMTPFQPIDVTKHARVHLEAIRSHIVPFL